MEYPVFHNIGVSQSTGYAVKALQQYGFTFTDELTECTHILADTPYTPGTLPETIPEGITVIGGNLPSSIHSATDLLQNQLYLAENANITAHCAVKLTLPMLSIVLDNCPVLIIGWGRIGKCLAKLLRQMGAKVSVAARKETDRAIISALGYNSVDISLCNTLSPRVIFNTVPVSVVKTEQFPSDCLMIELASTPGIIGDGVVDGRRLPGRFAPESSGELIARTIMRLLTGGN